MKGGDELKTKHSLFAPNPKQDTLAMILPVAWCRQHGLKPKDEVEIIYDDSPILTVVPVYVKQELSQPEKKG
jgi:hypothetical protein